MTIQDNSIGSSPGNAIRDTIVVDRNREPSNSRQPERESAPAETAAPTSSERSQTARTLVLSATLDGLQSRAERTGAGDSRFSGVDTAIEAAASELQARRNELATPQATEAEGQDASASSARVEEARDTVSESSDPQVRALAADPNVAEFLNQDFDLDTLDGVNEALDSTERAREAVNTAASERGSGTEANERGVDVLSQVLNVPSEDVLQGGDAEGAEQTAQQTAGTLSRLSLPLTIGVESQLRGY